MCRKEEVGWTSLKRQKVLVKKGWKEKLESGGENDREGQKRRRMRGKVYGERISRRRRNREEGKPRMSRLVLEGGEEGRKAYEREEMRR